MKIAGSGKWERTARTKSIGNPCDPVCQLNRLLGHLDKSDSILIWRYPLSPTESLLLNPLSSIGGDAKAERRTGSRVTNKNRARIIIL